MCLGLPVMNTYDFSFLHNLHMDTLSLFSLSLMLLVLFKSTSLKNSVSNIKGNLLITRKNSLGKVLKCYFIVLVLKKRVTTLLESPISRAPMLITFESRTDTRWRLLSLLVLNNIITSAWDESFTHHCLKESSDNV